MRFSIANMILCGGMMLLGGVGVYAQNYGHPPYGADPYDRGSGYGRSYGGWGGMALFEHVEDDLNRAASDVYGSHRHINHARKEVEDVEHQLRRGRFDRDEMGEAIKAVQHVVDDDPLPNVDRSMLWRDVAQMRQFRNQDY
jgi:hypothetical protein